MAARRTWLALVLLAALTIAGCGGDPSVAVVVSPAPPRAELIGECKIAAAGDAIGFGLPIPPTRLPSSGTVHTAVLFADFPDVPAVQPPSELFAILSPGAQRFFRDMSHGRMDWVLTPQPTWLRLSRPSAFYGEAIHSYDMFEQFIQEVVTLADPAVDFSAFDSVVVMIPPQATEVAYGPALVSPPGGFGYRADGKLFTSGVVSGSDLNAWGHLWLNHESGHTLGLPDLYEYGAATDDARHRFAGGFGLMGEIVGRGPELFAFERWQLGWLDDGQIACQPSGDYTTALTAIETPGGVKAAIVPLNDHAALVIESRRALGYDRDLPETGALVYTVDAYVSSGAGPLVVHPADAGDAHRYTAPLAAGESLTVEGVTITVLSATDQGDTVRVVVPQH